MGNSSSNLLETAYKNLAKESTDLKILKELFDKFDTNKSGELEGTEVTGIVTISVDN
jgi:hypothetical protein